MTTTEEQAVSESRIFLHVGFPKCASSYILTQVIPTLRGERVLLMDFPSVQKEINSLWALNPLFLEDECVRLRQLTKSLPDGDLIISNSKLVGELQRGYGESSFIAGALKFIFGSAKVLIVVRRQDTYLESHYLQFLKSRYNRSFKHFVGYRNGFKASNSSRGVFQTNAAALDWTRVIKAYDDIFGKEAVTVLPYEMLKYDPDKFCTALFEYFEIYPRAVELAKENPRCSRISMAILRVANSLMRTEFNSFGLPYYGLMTRLQERPGKVAKWGHRIVSAFYPRSIAEKIDRLYPSLAKAKPMQPFMRDELLAIHRENNKRLGERCGMDLSRYGYY